MIAENSSLRGHESSDDSPTRTHVLRTGAPLRRIRKYKRELYKRDSDTGGWIHGVKIERIEYVTGFKVAIRRNWQAGGKGGHAARGGNRAQSAGGYCGAGGFLPASDGANAPLDNCHISDRNSFDEFERRLAERKKLFDAEKPYYTSQTCYRWEREGWRLYDRTFYKIKGDFESGFTVRQITPSDYPSVGIVIPPERGQLRVRLSITGRTFKAKPETKPEANYSYVSNHGGGGLRRQITKFSPQSRSRMIERCAQIEEKRLAAFITLTYPDDVIARLMALDPEQRKVEMKRHESVLRKRIMRLNEKAGGLWRLENTERKSGQFVGQPVHYHYHLIAFGLVGHEKTRKNGKKSKILSLGVIRRWVLMAWHEIIGTTTPRKHTDQANKVLLCNDIQHVERYVSKYAAKLETEGLEGQDLGRRWAFFGNVSMSEETTQYIDFFEYLLFKNEVVKWLRSTGHKGKIRYAQIIEDDERGFKIFGLGRDTLTTDENQNQRRVLSLMLLHAGESRWFWEN